MVKQLVYIMFEVKESVGVFGKSITSEKTSDIIVTLSQYHLYTGFKLIPHWKL